MKMKLAAVTEEAAAADTKKLEALAQRIDQLEAALQRKNADAAIRPTPSRPVPRSRTVRLSQA